MRDNYPHENVENEWSEAEKHPGRGCMYAALVMALAIVCIVVIWRMVG